MATPFTQKRRNEISEKLKEGARFFLLSKSMKKITVDSLVEYAGISKGEYYNFYSSKDELFLEIVEDWHTEIYGTVLDILLENNNMPTKRKAAYAIYKACKILKKHSVLQFMNNDFKILLNNISDTDLIERYHSDDVHILEVIKYSGIKLIVTNEEAIAIIKNIVFTVLNSDIDGYWYAQKVIINSVCDYIIK